MKVINETPYDTRVLRSIIVRAYRAHPKKDRPLLQLWKVLEVRIILSRARLLEAAHLQDLNTHLRRLELKLPRLTGEEFIPAARAAGGTFDLEDARQRALVGRDVANVVFAALGSSHVGRWSRGHALWPDGNPYTLKKIPHVIPLKVVKPKEEKPKDVVQGRYQRVLALEEKWVKKLKFAETRLTAVRQKRRYYERQLAKKAEE